MEIQKFRMVMAAAYHKYETMYDGKSKTAKNEGLSVTLGMKSGQAHLLLINPTFDLSLNGELVEVVSHTGTIWFEAAEVESVTVFGR